MYSGKGQGLFGGSAIVILAVVFDRISQSIGARAQAYCQIANS